MAGPVGPTPLPLPLVRPPPPGLCHHLEAPVALAEKGIFGPAQVFPLRHLSSDDVVYE